MVSLAQPPVAAVKPAPFPKVTPSQLYGGDAPAFLAHRFRRWCEDRGRAPTRRQAAKFIGLFPVICGQR